MHPEKQPEDERDPSSPYSDSTYTDEYNGLLPGTEHIKRPAPPIQLSRLTAAFLTLGTFILFTITIYLLLLLHNLPLQVHTLLQESTYKGPIPIQHDPPTDCSFDLLANGWVPNPCFDAQKHDYYVLGKDFEFYLDPNGTTRVPQDEIMRGDTSKYNTWDTALWLSFREHLQHCSYLLNASVAAHARGSYGRLDVWVDAGHMNHCLMNVMQQGHEDDYIEYGIKAFFTNHRCYLK